MSREENSNQTREKLENQKKEERTGEEMIKTK